MPIFPIKVHAADKSDTANVTQGHVLKSIITGAYQCECILCHRTIHFKMVKTVHFMLYIFYHKKNLSCKESEKKVKLLGCLRLCDPVDWTLWTVAHQAPPSMGSPGKNTGVGCYFLLQGIFLTQGLNPGLPHCRLTL